MLANVCLLTCALALGQQADRAEWLLSPQLLPGQELVYSGHFTEESLQPGLFFQKKYRLQSHVFVVGTTSRGWEVALLTVLSPIQGAAHQRETTKPSSVRLALVEVDRQGRVQSSRDGGLPVPLFEPPQVEHGQFVVTPALKVSARHTWEVTEEGRPPRTYEIKGTTTINNTSCVQFLARQRSLDWSAPRADSIAWERQDTLSFSPQAGCAYQVERIILRRDPARNQPTHRYTVRYELESRLTFPGRLYEDRKQEILQAVRFQNDAELCMRQPAQQGPQIELLLRKISQHLEQQAPTPYRQALEQVKHRLEAARRGEVITTQEPQPPTSEPATLTVGRRAPDFAVTDLITRQTYRHQHRLGRPTFLFFYNPHTPTGLQVVRFAQDIQQQHGTGVLILGLAVTSDDEAVRKQHREMRLSFPVLDGRGLHVTFGVDATPRLIVLDGEGIMRCGLTGWGLQTPAEILGHLRRSLPAPRQP